MGTWETLRQTEPKQIIFKNALKNVLIRINDLFLKQNKINISPLSFSLTAEKL